MGWEQRDGPTPDVARTVVHERVLLRKFDGDWTDEEIEAGVAGEPVEVVVMETDKADVVWRQGDPGPPPA